jgi:hypothetical protein
MNGVLVVYRVPEKERRIYGYKYIFTALTWTFLLTKLTDSIAKFYSRFLQFSVSTTDGSTEVETRFHFTPHPREHIHRYRSDSKWGGLYPSAVHDVFHVPPEEEVCGCYIRTPWRPVNQPFPAISSTRKSFIYRARTVAQKWASTASWSSWPHFSTRWHTSLFLCHCTHFSARTISWSVDRKGRAY